MTRTKLYEDVFQSMEPVWEMRGVVRTLLAQGADREVLRQELTRFMLELRETGRERDEDVVYEVLQYLSGWCSSFMRL